MLPIPTHFPSKNPTHPNPSVISPIAEPLDLAAATEGVQGGAVGLVDAQALAREEDVHLAGGWTPETACRKNTVEATGRPPKKGKLNEVSI